MIRTGFCLLLLFISLIGRTQPDVIIFGGPQVRSALYKVNDEKQPSSYKPGFMAGVAMKVEFDNQLYFYPSVFYSLKGYKVTLNQPSFPPTELAINNDVSVHTMEICPLLQFDFSKNPQHMFLRFGPSVDIAFSGTETFDTLGTNGSKGSVTRPMLFSFADYGRFTAQVNFHLGYESPRLLAYAFYQRGFGSMNNADFGPTILHRILGLGLGWKLGRKR